MVESQKAPEFTAEIEEKLREFLRPDVDQQCVKILFNYLMAERFGVWEMFRSDVRGFTEGNVTMDMAEHITGHVWADARAGYGLPKMDLGISFWFGKLNDVKNTLLAKCEGFTPISDSGAESIARMKRAIPTYCKNVFGSLDRTSDINALIKKGYERDLQFGDMEDYMKAGNNYSFFVFLLPFNRDEDGRSLLPAYRRRVKFLNFFEENFRPEKKRDGDGELRAVAEVTTETAINAEMILGLSGPENILGAVKKNTDVIEDFSSAQILDLISRMTAENMKYKPGEGDTYLNYILERLIYALVRKISRDRKSANKGVDDIANRALALLGEKGPMAQAIYPPIIRARTNLLSLLESP